jgi:hypothetical protein
MKLRGVSALEYWDRRAAARFEPRADDDEEDDDEDEEGGKKHGPRCGCGCWAPHGDEQRLKWTCPRCGKQMSPTV